MKMNKNNLNGSKNSTNSNIENVISKLIKKYPNDYEEAFKEDDSYLALYHLSDVRKNLVRWYPFKANSSILEVSGELGALTDELCKKCLNVTTIASSKKHESIILERNKSFNNLKVIVGKFADINFDTKYDYILLNGSFEFSYMYVKGDNPYIEFLNKLKSLLKKDGKILISTDNRFGIKYWCGASYPHTGRSFDGLNNQLNDAKSKSFNKDELSKIFDECGLKYQFYYLFPDYRFPKVIYSDSFDVFVDYEPYYSTNAELILNEKKLYKEFFNNKCLDVFANSFFIELSTNKIQPKIDFVKFNNDYRKKEYDIFTYKVGNKVTKKCSNDLAFNHMLTMKNIYNICTKEKINIVKTLFNKSESKCDFVKSNTMLNYLSENKDNIELVQSMFDKIYNILIKMEKSNSSDATIFDTYNVDVDDEYKKQLHFIKNGLIDFIPGNILYKNNECTIYDQEWFEENVPIEYILYRGMKDFFLSHKVSEEVFIKLYIKYNINIDLFDKLEAQFYKKVFKDSSSVHTKYCLNYVTINPSELYNENIMLKNEVNTLSNKIVKDKNDNDEKEKEFHRIINEKDELINSILNSKWWKLKKIILFWKK